MPDEGKQEQIDQLIALIQEALQKDAQLRQTHEIGEKFRFVRDRLQMALETIQRETTVQQTQAHLGPALKVEDDEMLVYIHLYSSQGAMLRTWQSMITPKAFFDFSVNRPIYIEKKDIELFIRNKTNKSQHAYLTVAMKKDRVLPVSEEAALKDSLGNRVVKIKEGSLHHQRMVSFTHDEQEYVRSEEGILVKKISETTNS